MYPTKGRNVQRLSDPSAPAPGLRDGTVCQMLSWFYKGMVKEYTVGQRLNKDELSALNWNGQIPT